MLPMRKAVAVFVSGVIAVAILTAACGFSESIDDAPTLVPEDAVVSLPPPMFHHIHINSVDPDRSIAWYSDYWPQGEATTYAGFQAFYDDIYLLYTQVDTQAPGGFDRELQRSEPQSGFWTFGSTFAGPNTDAFRERIRNLDPAAFEFVTLYGGADGGDTALHALALPMGDALLRASSIAERSEEEAADPPTPPTSGLDFAYLVDPDGMLVEVTAGHNDSFRSHTHFWAEHPLCAANWHVEHLGARFPENQNTFSSDFNFSENGWSPCEVPTGEVTFPTYMEVGQLRIPAGNVRVGNASWLWYPRQCRDGRCGAGLDRSLVRSRGQVVDHIGLTYPDLDDVLAHLEAKSVPILEGPYTLGETRAILIEDPNSLAYELIEAHE